MSRTTYTVRDEFKLYWTEIRDSLRNINLIAAVKKEFPKSAFKDTHAAWYRSQARKGLLTGTPIEIPAMSRKQSTTAA